MSDVNTKVEKIGIGDLVGMTFNAVHFRCVDYQDEIVFRYDGGEIRMTHEQDCCESVALCEISPTRSMAFWILAGTPILSATVNVYECNPVNDESATATFYKISTIKGMVDIQWRGESNGHYSEEVDLIRIEAKEHKQ